MDHVQPAALPPGSRIAEYEIVRVLGAGGFGITYLAYDHQLDGPVALKEYFPADVASRTDGSGVAATATTNQDLFAWGLDRFIQEARAIHRLRHPNVVRAHRYLEAKGTAYIVLEYVEGEPLKAILDRRGRLSADEWRPWMNALLDGLAHVHAHGYLHRDIKPANIVVRLDNGEPVLIDFGSARLQHGDRTLTQVLTAGYAPIEQYSNDAAQGPQGDIYAMAAVSYRVLTGNAVLSAPDRVLNDGYEPLAEGSTDADSRWLAAIDRGLAIRPEDRPQTVEEWRAELCTSDVEGANTVSLGTDAAGEQRGHGDPPIKSLRRTGRPAVAAADTIECKVPGAPERPPAQQRVMRLWWAVPVLVGPSLLALRLATGPIEDVQRAVSPVRTCQSMNRKATPKPVRSARSASPPALSSLSPEASPIDPPSDSPSDVTTLPVRPRRPAINQTRTPPSQAPAQVDRQTGSSKPHFTRGSDQDRPQLGVVLVDGARLRPLVQGVVVWEVARNSGADRAGLRGARQARSGGVVLGDVITAIEDHPVRSVSDIRAALERQKPGDKVRVTLQRDREKVKVEVRLSAPHYITIGSHEDDVLNLHGPPTRAANGLGGSKIWFYGEDNYFRISARTQVVVGWRNHGQNIEYAGSTSHSGQELKVRLLPGDKGTETPYFTLGSHQDDVLRLHDTPTEIVMFDDSEYKTWGYGFDYVTISTDSRKVLAYSNFFEQLKVQIKPGDGGTRRPYFTTGSHQDDVLRLQGTPTSISRRRSSGRAVEWTYGSSYVNISTRTLRVLNWWDPHGQLKSQ